MFFSVKLFTENKHQLKKRKKKVMGGGFGRSLCYRLAFSMGRTESRKGL
jgi:hypothetical protein